MHIYIINYKKIIFLVLFDNKHTKFTQQNKRVYINLNNMFVTLIPK